MEARRSPNFFYIKPEKAWARSLKPEPEDCRPDPALRWISPCVFWSVPFCSNFIPFPPSRSAPCRLCIYWVKLFHFISFSISPSLSLRSVLFWLSITFRSVPLVHVIIEKNFPSLPPSLPRVLFRSEVNLSVCVFWSFHLLLPVPFRSFPFSMHANSLLFYLW